jgi:hypothetical protein
MNIGGGERATYTGMRMELGLRKACSEMISWGLGNEGTTLTRIWKMA